MTAPGRTLLEALRANAEQRGDAIAVTDGQQQLSYAELWRRCGQVAAALAERDLALGSPVAVRLPSSPQLLVTMLGILRAGLIYLPLDPVGPVTRSRRILDDSDARLVVGGADAVDLATTRRPMLSVEELLAGEHSGDFPDRVGPDGPAYLIYTSGSTGLPKGVLVGHRAITAYLADIEPWYRIVASDVVLQFASPEFDISVEDIVTTMAAGGRLVCRPPDLLGSIHRFLDLCQAHGVTVVNLPTAYWHWLTNSLAELGASPPAALRQIMMGGEQILADHLVIWRQLSGQRVRIINTYGLSETTATVTVADVTADTDQVPPMGQPLAAYDTYVVDGEFQVAGALLATGYWSNPALTADRFRPDPFSDRPGTRLFRTGDLVHRRSDGAFVFAGRADRQVKIAGNRIELSEVEAVLRESPEVRDALVQPLRAGGVVVGLAAFVVPASVQPPTQRSLADLVNSRLPSVARPVVLRHIRALPMGPTGKVDRDRLDPARDGERLLAGVPYAAPSTPAEQALADIWLELLDAERIGLDDDFLTLGGNSLQAIAVVARLRQRLGVDLPASAVLGGGTLAELAGQFGHANDVEPAPPLVDVEDDLTGPLSPTQQRVWFVTQLEAHNPAYQYQMYVRLIGPLDVAALQAALSEVVDRHEIMRTTFEERDGEPVQRVHPTYLPELPVLDAGEVEAAGGLDTLTRRECATGFDLGRLPLARWSLLRMSDQEHLLIHVEHHLLHDGWSLGRFLADLEHSYRATVAGRRPHWAAPAPRYRDYARAQLSWLDSAEAERQRTFWRDQLAGAPPVTALPTDYPRTEQQRFAGAVHRATVPGDLVRRVATTALRHRTTLFAVMMAAFAALVHRHTGQRDLLLGTSHANRGDERVEDLIGMVVNNLVLRVRTGEQQSAGELIEAVRSGLLAAFDHHQLPFEQVVEAAALPRDLRINPLFQLMFSFHDSPVGRLDLAGVEGRVGYLNNNTAKFDLNVIVMPDPSALDDAPGDGGIVVEWEYNTDVFAPETVARLAGGYLQLLDALTEDERRPVAALPVLTEPELATLDHAGDGAAAFGPAGLPVELWPAFAAAAQSRPDRIAVRWTEAGQRRELSYGRLHQQAERLASHLASRGLGPEQVVAIATGRCGHTLLGVLAAYSAGAGFLLLDADLPAPRRALLLQDSAAEVVLTCSHACQIEVAMPVLRLDQDWPASAAVPAVAHPGNLAYLIYTSGSTGRPKGVQVPREGLTHYLTWCQQYRLGPGQRVPVHTPYGVDLTVTSLLAPLTAGATVELLPCGLPGQEALAATVAAAGADLIKLTPSHLRALALQLPEPLPEHSVTLVIGGEALFEQDLASWTGRTRALNEYGPTEAVVGCTVADWSPGTGPAGGAVPIGRPTSHARVAVRDELGALAPYGAFGQLHIGGSALARGYLNAPAATAEAFRPDPGNPGGRAYRSGDVVRWRSDGQLDYVGRADRQVKLRGFRVDPGEVEAALSAIPGVGAAAVHLAGTGVDQQLIGYVVAQHAHHLRAGEVVAALQGRLPAHLVPAPIHVVEQLPTTTGGKIDYAALADLAAASDIAPSALAELVTAGQREIARIWSEVLKVDDIGADSDFFALGGHSLAALRVVARLRESGWPHARLHDVFAQRTVAALAATIEGGRS